jgi:hypothetical protein
MINNKPTNLNEQIARMQSLMGVNKLNETKKSQPLGIIEKTVLGNDGCVYGIVRENNKFYIKKASDPKDIKLENFEYLGGSHRYKNLYEYSSIANAEKILKEEMVNLSKSIDKSKTLIEEAKRVDMNLAQTVTSRQMREEIDRQREIMANASKILKEDSGIRNTKQVLNELSIDDDEKILTDAEEGGGGEEGLEDVLNDTPVEGDEISIEGDDAELDKQDVELDQELVDKIPDLMDKLDDVAEQLKQITGEDLTDELGGDEEDDFEIEGGDVTEEPLGDETDEYGYGNEGGGEEPLGDEIEEYSFDDLEGEDPYGDSVDSFLNNPKNRLPRDIHEIPGDEEFIDVDNDVLGDEEFSVIDDDLTDDERQFSGNFDKSHLGLKDKFDTYFNENVNTQAASVTKTQFDYDEQVSDPKGRNEVPDYNAEEQIGVENFHKDTLDKVKSQAENGEDITVVAETEKFDWKLKGKGGENISDHDGDDIKKDKNTPKTVDEGKEFYIVERDGTIISTVKECDLGMLHGKKPGTQKNPLKAGKPFEKQIKEITESIFTECVAKGIITNKK